MAVHTITAHRSKIKQYLDLPKESPLGIKSRNVTKASLNCCALLVELSLVLKQRQPSTLIVMDAIDELLCECLTFRLTFVHKCS